MFYLYSKVNNYLDESFTGICLTVKDQFHINKCLIYISKDDHFYKIRYLSFLYLYDLTFEKNILDKIQYTNVKDVS